MTDDALVAAVRELEARLPKAPSAVGQVILLIPMIAGAVVGFVLAFTGERERRVSKLFIIVGALAGFGVGVALFELFKRWRRASLIPEIAQRHAVTADALRAGIARG